MSVCVCVRVCVYVEEGVCLQCGSMRIESGCPGGEEVVLKKLLHCLRFLLALSHAFRHLSFKVGIGFSPLFGGVHIGR